MPLFALLLPAGAVHLHFGSEQSFVKFETQKVRPKIMCLHLSKVHNHCTKVWGWVFVLFFERKREINTFIQQGCKYPVWFLQTKKKKNTNDNNKILAYYNDIHRVM